MKTLKRNQRQFWYCLFDDTSENKDRYGNRRTEYSEPVLMKANVSEATGTAKMQQFGIFDDYNKVIVTCDMNCPITESSVLFIDKDPEHDSSGQPLYDYIVRRISRSLNSISIAIKKVNVS